MANIPKVSVESNFTGGLKTEFTGLNFPENAATDTENCVYTITGDVTRRLGYDYETNFVQTTIDRTGKAISTYKWNNAGGDGLTQILVEQIGNILYFYKTSSATIASPISNQALTSTVLLTSYIPTGSANDPSTVECQYADGNGYLIVYHPYLESFFCTYSAGTVIPNQITVNTRDFDGLVESVPDTTRLTTLSNNHKYNLQNQGWTSAPVWSATSTTAIASINGPATGILINSGTYAFTVASGITGISNGQVITAVGGITYSAPGGNFGMNFTVTGTVSSYSGTTLTLIINGGMVNASQFAPQGTVFSIVSNTWAISTGATNNLIDAWHTAEANYPSNSDVWWAYKDSTGIFNPTTKASSVVQNSSPAPKGYYILPAFIQNRSIISGITSLSLDPISTYTRPKTGAWFQGRVWYTGVDASLYDSGTNTFYTWSENIYFSQIVTNTTDFGSCYQANDPTSETLFGLLPSDGGVIKIQGCGSIYKLFPIQNGMLVFAANGIWFITGSQGIGFTANDYTITKISQVQSISSTSFVNVNGLPIFWNEEGIYTVEPAQQGLGLTVNPITVGTILSFYAAIPLQSKKYARGDYHPLDYTIKWIYRNTNESTVTDRYQFDTILNLNTYNKAFFPYSLAGTPHIHAINYIAGPGGSTSPDPAFKYVTSVANAGSYKFTFSEESSTRYLDWYSFDSTGTNYSSYFVTGYKIHGQALRQWQPEYINVYSSVPSYYKIQGIWNYAKSGNSGKYSSIQVITNDSATYGNFGIVMRRHRIRGHGTVFQFKVLSVTGQPFDISGWAMQENVNAGV